MKMKITGVIAEYNQLHNGHQYHFNNINSDLKILIMSSSYTMRGDLSIFDKFTKARQALDLGFDLVIELPFVYSVERADIFSNNTVSFLNLCTVKITPITTGRSSAHLEGTFWLTLIDKSIVKVPWFPIKNICGYNAIMIR